MIYQLSIFQALLLGTGFIAEALANTHHMPEPPVFLMKAPPKPPWTDDVLACPNTEPEVLSSPDPLTVSEWPLTSMTTVGLAVGLTTIMVPLMLFTAFFVYKWYKKKTSIHKVSPKKVPDTNNSIYNYPPQGRKYAVPPEDHTSSRSTPSIGEKSALVKNEAGSRRTSYLHISNRAKDRLSLESNSSGIGTGMSEHEEEPEEDYVTLEPTDHEQPVIAMWQASPASKQPSVVRRHPPPDDTYMCVRRMYLMPGNSHTSEEGRQASSPLQQQTHSPRCPPPSPQPVMGLKARSVSNQGLPSNSLRRLPPGPGAVPTQALASRTLPSRGITAQQSDLVLHPVLLPGNRSIEAYPLGKKKLCCSRILDDSKAGHQQSHRMAVKYIKGACSNAEADTVYVNRDAVSESQA